MWDFSIGRTLGLLARTYPFILLRMLVYFGITFAYIVATGGGAAIGYGVGRIVAEFFREPDPQLEALAHGLTMGMVLSLPMIVIGLWLIVRSKTEGGKP